MDQPLAGKTVLILVASGFEEVEMTEPQRALLKAGAKIKVASVNTGLVNGWHGTGWGHYFQVDAAMGEVLGSDYDLLLLPGGERSVLKLKQSAHTRRIINAFLDGGKPVAAIGRGLELLALTGQKLKGRSLTGPADLKATLEEAGANWSDEAVTVDNNVVTAHSAEVLPMFLEEALRIYAGGNVVQQAA